MTSLLKVQSFFPYVCLFLIIGGLSLSLFLHSNFLFRVLEAAAEKARIQAVYDLKRKALEDRSAQVCSRNCPPLRRGDVSSFWS